MRIVVFVKTYRMYQPGERAGFDDTKAEQLINGGLAVDEEVWAAIQTATETPDAAETALPVPNTSAPAGDVTPEAPSASRRRKPADGVDLPQQGAAAAGSEAGPGLPQQGGDAGPALPQDGD